MLKNHRCKIFQSTDAPYHRMVVHPTLALLQYFHTTVAESSATFNIKFTAFLNYLTVENHKIIIFPPRPDFYPSNNICFLECFEDRCSHADLLAVWPVPF